MCLLAVAPSAVRDSASSNYKLDDFKSLSKKEIKSIMQVRIELSSFKSIAELLPSSLTVNTTDCLFLF